MLERLIIKNFQSIKDADLELGKFTVIVGESSHGKSAILRAINAVASNQLDSENITQGKNYSAVTAKTELGSVTIERKTGGSSAYQVAKFGGEESAYTKLNRQVPSEVTEILSILPNTKEVSSINFAGQHDSPYLLKDGASTVARVLGDLTNVSTIFEAVKEASKRAKAANTLVNLRKKDLDKVLSQISDYAKVAHEAKAISALEDQLLVAQRLETEFLSLSTIVDDLSSSEKVLENYVNYPVVPELGEVLGAQEQVNTFIFLAKMVASTTAEIKALSTSVDQSDADILFAEDRLHQTLVTAGECPLCNQSIE